MNIDTEYLRIVNKIITSGELKQNRTGMPTIAIPGEMIQWNMSDGFPLLTTKRVPFKVIKVELEGFLKGISSKKWFQERGCHIWDEWCNPQKVPYANDDKTKLLMKQEDDLGEIYGRQWRDFHQPELGPIDEYNNKLVDHNIGMGVDQLSNIIKTLKTNPNDRRMICSAWNPTALGQMALPPCHLLWQITVINNKLNLMWYQRSVDVALGLPFNIASYALLLHLLAKEANLEEGTLTGFLADVHIYTPHINNLKLQLARTPFPMPNITTNFNGILNWTYEDTTLQNYQSHDKLSFEVAV